MKKLTLFVIFTAFSISSYADVFDELDKETALIDKFCADGQGRVSEESITNRNNKTGEIVSQQRVNVIYCKDGSRHVVGESNNRNKLLKNTEKLLDGLKQKTSTKTYTCTFESSFLMGICNGKQYFYDEKLSSIKRKDLSSFYRFVKNSQSDMVSDTCERFKGESKKMIKCNDIGLVLEFGGS